MAITISTQDNPNIKVAGTAAGDATVINSGFTDGIVIYQIRREDRNGIEANGLDIELLSTDSITDKPQIVSLSAATLKIILPFRQKFEVRVKRNSGSWSSWMQFKTRDKRYQSPDATTQLSDNSDSTSGTVNSRTITVTNTAKATVTNTAAGATVVNSDKFYSGTTSITETNAGATIINTSVEQVVSTGVRINTNS